MIRLRDVKRFTQRGTGAIAIIIGFILLTVTAALAITTMISMNSTRSEDLAQRATQAAYSGLNQFLLDVEQGSPRRRPQQQPPAFGQVPHQLQRL